MSLSSWRAWIEILRSWPSTTGRPRSPHGERGLKSYGAAPRRYDEDRSPHGERGLKSRQFGEHGGQLVVALLMESVD